MTRDERETMRAQLAAWRPKMTVEVRVDVLRALLDEADRLEGERDELLLATLEEGA